MTRFALAAVFVAFLASAADGGQAILIYGGVNHGTFLGCLNCGKYDANSVNNKYGTYGSPYSITSIFNRYGLFGGRYSNTSPCNPYASDPPVLVDQSGGFYGYLTLNRFHENAVSDGSVVGWLTAICQ